jgi:hypothetical protein
MLPDGVEGQRQMSYGCRRVEWSQKGVADGKVGRSDLCCLAVKVEWKEEVNTPVTPNLIGSRAFVDYPIEDVLEYIDW